MWRIKIYGGCMMIINDNFKQVNRSKYGVFNYLSEVDIKPYWKIVHETTTNQEFEFNADLKLLCHEVKDEEY